MTDITPEPGQGVPLTVPGTTDPLAALGAMIGELAQQIDVLTGLVQGQDSEGSWMSPQLSQLLRSSLG